MEESLCSIRIITRILLFLILLFLINPVISDDMILDNRSYEDDFHENLTGLLNGEDGQDLSLLINLLKKIGVDLSYSEDGGSLFSMIDSSLNQIILDLSSGNPQGIMSNPLIGETMNEIGVNLDEVIVNPDNFNSTLKAIEGYEDLK